jgi:CO dehydrogenase maturation factor
LGFVIALSGKGGTGKTTLAALMVRHLSRSRGKAVLAVDADPNSGLGEALGVSPEHTVADIREDTREDRLQLSAGMSKERHVELLIQSCLVEGNKFDLLTMGRPEGPKCYCYVNNLLRRYLDDATKEYPMVVIDNEAGMEHLSRRTTNNVDELFVVSDATRQGGRTVERIMRLADSLPILVKRKEVLLNHVVPGADGDEFRTAMREAGFSVALEVPYDRGLYQACAAGKPVFDLPDSSEALQRLGRFLDERVP